MSKFASYIQTYGSGLKDVIAGVESGTIFAPNNEAFDRLSQSQIEQLLESDAGPRLLGLHFIDQRIPAEDVRILQPQNAIKVCRKTLAFLHSIAFNDVDLVNRFYRSTPLADSHFHEMALVSKIYLLKKAPSTPQYPEKDWNREKMPVYDTHTLD